MRDVHTTWIFILNNLFLKIKIKAFELSHFLSEYCITYWMTNGYRYSSYKREPGFLSHSQLFTCLKLYYSTCQYVKQLICINPFTVNKI